MSLILILTAAPLSKSIQRKITTICNQFLHKKHQQKNTHQQKIRININPNTLERVKHYRRHGKISRSIGITANGTNAL